MWMKGYNDRGEIYLPTTNNDPFSGSGKLRPLIPRPPPPHHYHLPNPTTNPPTNHHHSRHGHNQPCLGRGDHNDDHFLTLNHHLATTAEQSKRELNVAQQVVVTSRWNPTPEQLRTLEDLWRRGTRTPSADEIQQITSWLRRYGKIEGKNVFYWFQNHKARERQKRRRQMESGGCPDQEEHDHCETGNLGHKDADTGGSSKTASEDVRRSNNDTPINNNNNWINHHFLNSSESAVENEGKLAVGGGTASASSGVVSVSLSPVVTSLRMKKSNDNNSMNARELLLHSPNSNIFGISGSCCRDEDNDNDDDDVNAPVGWHYPIATPPGSFFTYSSSSSSCRPLLVPPCPISAGRMIVTVPPEMTASRLSSPALSSPLPNHDFQTLQLFPLRSCLDNEEDYAKGFGGRRDDDNNRRTGVEFAARNGHVDHLQFFEFLPLKN